MKEPFNLKNAIKNKGMTQKQFANACGYSLNSLARYFTKQRMPRPAMLRKMSEILGVKIETLAAHLLEDK